MGYLFYLFFKQLHVIINNSIMVVCVNMEIQVFNLFNVYDGYQVSKHWHRHRLQNKRTGKLSCGNCNFEVLKLQFVALLSPCPRCYRKTYPRPNGITVKTVPIPAVLPRYPSQFITNSVIGVSRPPVLDCGTTFHLDYGGQDLPSTPSDNL